MKDFVENALIVAVTILVSVIISYGMARIGNPNAVWFWRDIMHVEIR